MSTATLSIRIKKELREKMKRLSNVDWGAEIERFIEEKGSGGGAPTVTG